MVNQNNTDHTEPGFVNSSTNEILSEISDETQLESIENKVANDSGDNSESDLLPMISVGDINNQLSRRFSNFKYLSFFFKSQVKVSGKKKRSKMSDFDRYLKRKVRKMIPNI